MNITNYSITMKLKTYETPEVEVFQLTTEVNFCESGGLPGMTVDDYDPNWI
jgi:hypothetical protein